MSVIAYFLRIYFTTKVEIWYIYVYDNFTRILKWLVPVFLTGFWENISNVPTYDFPTYTVLSY